jgi:hypothetical protein
MCTPADVPLGADIVIRGEHVHYIDECGCLTEVTGPLRGVLLGEAEAARILHRLARLPGAVRGGRE